MFKSFWKEYAQKPNTVILFVNTRIVCVIHKDNLLHFPVTFVSYFSMSH